jgi:hypothetical protein
VLCGRFYLSELQNNSIPIWWSTGVYDTLFPPSLLTEYSAVVAAVRSDFVDSTHVVVQVIRPHDRMTASAEAG